ncbi:Hypothetical protein SRAE_2000093600 [Strongyloides ratti]|uniref:Uncharacterized protein n=1 Tax=Strongyloides ratti TaxID=34506 RepID=A0A090L921_STRRB|nr:Hypothetical protein SRAE_2000093600 [Strongyloides ratti]CEF66266.1 Hypothetical protein SRAE_2000093600 [Strongyloides ratti]
MSSANNIEITNFNFLDSQRNPIATVTHQTLTIAGPSNSGVIEIPSRKTTIKYSIKSKTVVSSTSVVIHNLEGALSDTINNAPN